MAETTAPAGAPAPAPTRRGLDSAWLRRYGVYLALALLVVVNVAITPNFVSTASLRLLLVQVAPIVVVALGMALVIGTGGIDLSVGATIALAAAVIPLYIGYGTAGAVLAALLSGALVGALGGTVIARFGIQPIVATLAIMVAGRGVANLVGGEIRTLRDPGIREIGTGDLLGVPWVVLTAAAVAVAVWLLVSRTTTGRQIVAVGGNLRASALAGVPVERVLTTVYVVSGLLAALAGVLLAARSQASDPTRLGLLVELQAITAVVVGGTPLTGGQVRVLGTVAGAVLMQLVGSTLIAQNAPPPTTLIVQALIVVLAVYLQLGTRRRA